MKSHLRKFAGTIAILLALCGFGGAPFTAPSITVIGQSNLPMVYLASAAVGNNGALTLTTALATAYANAYCYLPAAAIVGGSAAGWYYCTFSTTSAGTIFNNVYTNGTPTIPISPTPFVTTGPGAFVQTTASDIQAYQLTITANTLGARDSIEVRAEVTQTDTTSNTFRLKFGSTTWRTLTLTNVSYYDLSCFINRESQAINMPCPAVSSGGFGASSQFPTPSAINFATSNNLNTTVNSSNVLKNITIENIVIKRISGVS